MPGSSRGAGAEEIRWLTDDQTRALDTVRDQWLAHGLATEPPDRAEAERGVVEAYRAVRRRPPRRFVWLDSPLTGSVAASLLTTTRARGGRCVAYEVVRPLRWAEEQARRRVVGPARSRIEADVRNRVFEQAVHWKYAVALQVLAHAREPHGWVRIRDQVREEVRVQARVRVRAPMPARSWNLIWEWLSDQHVGGDLALHDFLGTSRVAMMWSVS